MRLDILFISIFDQTKNFLCCCQLDEILADIKGYKSFNWSDFQTKYDKPMLKILNNLRHAPQATLSLLCEHFKMIVNCYMKNGKTNKRCSN